jgi:hypothetical protein
MKLDELMKALTIQNAMGISDDDLMIIVASNARKLYCEYSNFESCKEHAIALTIMHPMRITHRERVAMSLTARI